MEGTRTVNTVQKFVLDITERATKTAAESAILAIGANGLLNAWSVNWPEVGGFALGGMVLSILMSLASSPFGDKTTASLLPGNTVPVPPSNVIR